MKNHTCVNYQNSCIYIAVRNNIKYKKSAVRRRNACYKFNICGFIFNSGKMDVFISISTHLPLNTERTKVLFKRRIKRETKLNIVLAIEL